MKKSLRTARRAVKVPYEKEYARLLRQWMTNAATMAQDEPDPAFRLYLKSWYSAFESTLEALTNGTEVQIRVFTNLSLPNFDREETYAEVE